MFNPHKTGLVIGGFLGLVHAAWSIMVATNLAQPFLDSIFTLHMVQPIYQVMPFSLPLAITLIIFTSIIGYISGYVFATIWDICHKK